MTKLAIAVLTLTSIASAASIGGSVVDPSGAPVEKARVTFWNAEASRKKSIMTDATGVFSFGDLEAGQYLMHVDKYHVGSSFREFTIESDSRIERKIFIGAAGSFINPEVPAEQTVRRVRVGGQIVASRIIRMVQPTYPSSAKNDRIQGVVVMAGIIRKDGAIGELTVKSSPSDDLAIAALDAVRQWKYTPTTVNGEPAEVITTFEVNFQLRR